MARYTVQEVQSDPFIAEFVAFGCGSKGQPVYTMRQGLANIIGRPDIEASVRSVFDMEPQAFITLCMSRSDLDKEFFSKN